MKKLATKTIDITGIGCALLDIEARINDSFLDKFKLQKGSMTIVEPRFQQEVIQALLDKKKHYSSGGSAANTMAALAKLGKNVAYINHTADDEMGDAYRKDLKSLGVKLPKQAIEGQRTGTCLVLIDDKGERTMLTELGCAGSVSLDEYSLNYIANSKIVYIEGYLLETDQGRKTAYEAAAHAYKNNVQIALSASDFTTVKRQKEHFMKLFDTTDIIFANSDEMRVLSSHMNQTKHKSIIDCSRDFIQSNAFTSKEKTSRLLLVLTQGDEGARLFAGGSEHHVPAKNIKVVDLTGAGDAFAAGVLARLIENSPLQNLGSLACDMAAEVISRYGARY